MDEKIEKALAELNDPAAALLHQMPIFCLENRRQTRSTHRPASRSLIGAAPLLYTYCGIPHRPVFDLPAFLHYTQPDARENSNLSSRSPGVKAWCQDLARNKQLANCPFLVIGDTGLVFFHSGHSTFGEKAALLLPRQ